MAGGEVFAMLFGLLIISATLGGAVCGIVALILIRSVEQRLRRLQTELGRLKHERDAVPSRSEPAIAEKVPAATEERPPTPVVATGPVVSAAPFEKKLAPLEAPPPPPPPFRPPARRPSPQRPSFEITLGSQWLLWLGAVTFVIGVALGLKFAYDTGLIGPRGRLAIGVLTGIAALILGEKARRSRYGILFQALTGIGVAIFYICDFYSFQVYQFIGSGVALVLALGITAGAVVLAAGHDAVVIAILGLIGGFLSPVLLSTGENHPYVLFTYIIIVDLMALGAAYFRRWRGVDLLAFAGAMLMYAGWYVEFYKPVDQMAPALLFLSIFYVLFLLIPSFHSLVRRVPQTLEGLVVVVANAGVSVGWFYAILYREHRYALGFVLVGQAALVFLLFRAWIARMVSDRPTSEALLIITLALITLAIPLELKLYSIPIAWAFEGVLLLFLGIRFERFTCRIAGTVALFLAAGGLFDRLPLHRVSFTPVFNVPFGSWAVVIGAAAVGAYLLYRARDRLASWERYLPVAPSVLGYILACIVLSLEVAHYWDLVPTGIGNRTYYKYDSLVALWSVIPLATVAVIAWRKLKAMLPLAWCAYAAATLIVLAGFVEEAYRLPSSMLALNSSFLTRLALVASLWFGAHLIRRLEEPSSPDVLESAGHVLLAILAACELVRWARFGGVEFISPKMARGLISAVWAAQAFILIWMGLRTRNPVRRYMGFALFGVAVAKTWLIDTWELQAVYRIVSWLGSGAFLLIAAYFYQRYAPRLLAGSSQGGDRSETSSENHETPY